MKRVVMTPNPYRDRDFSCVREAQRVLEQAGVEVKICLAFDVDPSFALPPDVPITDLNEGLKTAEALICFGGDGTILHTSKLAMRRNIPILGVNIGTVGFMAELESSEMELLAGLAADDYTLDERMTIFVRLLHEGRIIYRDTALNDAVITKGAVARVIQTAVFLDGVEAMNFSGDGLIAATPTGSTAYSMAAGGPIVEPSAKNMIITPISPHALFARALVLSPGREVRIETGRLSDRHAYMTADGTEPVPLMDGDIVIISTSECVTRLVQLNDISFYEKLYRKLGEKQ